MSWTFPIGAKHELHVKQQLEDAALNLVVMILDFSFSMADFYPDLERIADAVAASGSPLIIFSTEAFVHDLSGPQDYINWCTVKKSDAYGQGTKFSAALEKAKPCITPNSKVFFFTDGEVDQDDKRIVMEKHIPDIHAILRIGTGSFKTFYAQSQFRAPLGLDLLTKMCFNKHVEVFKIDHVSTILRDLLTNTVRCDKDPEGVRVGSFQVTGPFESVGQGDATIHTINQVEVALGVAAAIMFFFKSNSQNLNAANLLELNRLLQKFNSDIYNRRFGVREAIDSVRQLAAKLGKQEESRVGAQTAGGIHFLLAAARIVTGAPQAENKDEQGEDQEQEEAFVDHVLDTLIVGTANNAPQGSRAAQLRLFNKANTKVDARAGQTALQIARIIDPLAQLLSTSQLIGFNFAVNPKLNFELWKVDPAKCDNVRAAIMCPEAIELTFIGARTRTGLQALPPHTVHIVTKVIDEKGNVADAQESMLVDLLKLSGHRAAGFIILTTTSPMCFLNALLHDSFDVIAGKQTLDELLGLARLYLNTVFPRAVGEEEKEGHERSELFNLSAKYIYGASMQAQDEERQRQQRPSVPCGPAGALLLPAFFSQHAKPMKPWWVITQQVLPTLHAIGSPSNMVDYNALTEILISQVMQVDFGAISDKCALDLWLTQDPVIPGGLMLDDPFTKVIPHIKCLKAELNEQHVELLAGSVMTWLERFNHNQPLLGIADPVPSMQKVIDLTRHFLADKTVAAETIDAGFSTATVLLAIASLMHKGKPSHCDISKHLEDGLVDVEFDFERTNATVVIRNARKVPQSFIKKLLNTRFSQAARELPLVKQCMAASLLKDFTPDFTQVRTCVKEDACFLLEAAAKSKQDGACKSVVDHFSLDLTASDVRSPDVAKEVLAHFAHLSAEQARERLLLQGEEEKEGHNRLIKLDFTAEHLKVINACLALADVDAANYQHLQKLVDGLRVGTLIHLTATMVKPMFKGIKLHNAGVQEQIIQSANDRKLIANILMMFDIDGETQSALMRTVPGLLALIDGQQQPTEDQRYLAQALSHNDLSVLDPTGIYNARPVPNKARDVALSWFHCIQRMNLCQQMVDGAPCCGNPIRPDVILDYFLRNNVRHLHFGLSDPPPLTLEAFMAKRWKDEARFGNLDKPIPPKSLTRTIAAQILPLVRRIDSTTICVPESFVLIK